ncbi:MAG: PepSY domain-containing protein [Henriciella sp.]|nr:PepSY domain-containing protein [Henriciella sp.]
MSLLTRRISRVHKIVGLVVGIQLFFWTVSGLFFTLYPIDVIRGDPWRPKIEHGSLEKMTVAVDAKAAAAKVEGNWLGAELKPFLDRPVWLISTSETRAMVDAETGELWSPLDPVSFRALQRRFADSEGKTQIPGRNATATYLTKSAPREYGGALPAWVIEDKTTQQKIYFDANTGAVKAVRTTNWRIFDVLWRFHIMDVTGEDRFNTWWMKLFAFLALTMVLSGFVLIIDRVRKGRLLR